MGRVPSRAGETWRRRHARSRGVPSFPLPAPPFPFFFGYVYAQINFPPRWGPFFFCFVCCSCRCLFRWRSLSGSQRALLVSPHQKKYDIQRSVFFLVFWSFFFGFFLIFFFVARAPRCWSPLLPDGKVPKRCPRKKRKRKKQKAPKKKKEKDCRPSVPRRVRCCRPLLWRGLLWRCARVARGCPVGVPCGCVDGRRTGWGAGGRRGGGCEGRVGAFPFFFLF